jgi:hypothetical protein
MFLGFMAITHSLIAAAGTSLIIGTAEPMALGLAILGSQLPDIDTTTSTIGKIFFPISSFLEDRFPHHQYGSVKAKLLNPSDGKIRIPAR